MNVTNTRRTLLKVAAALGGSSFVAVGAAQDESTETEADIQLGGETSGWQGISPDGIEGDTNPTLELTAGEEYVLEWENLDGAGHNFVIEDDDGSDLVETDITTSGTQTVEFAASEEMAEYYCQPHPTSMRGDIEIVEGTGSEGETGESDESPAEFAAPVDEIHDLTLDGDGWHLEAAGTGDAEETETDAEAQAGTDQPDNETENGQPDDGTGNDQPEQDGETAETNPTLELEAGGVYVLRVVNELEAEDVADGEDGGDSADQDGDDEDELDSDVQRQTTELVVFDENDEEVVRSDVAESTGGSAAVVLTATDGLAGYRDEATGAEGEIDVQESEDGDGTDAEGSEGSGDTDGGDP